MSQPLEAVQNAIDAIESGETQYGYLHDINLAIVALGGTRQFSVEGSGPNMSLVLAYIGLLVARKTHETEQPE